MDGGQPSAGIGVGTRGASGVTSVASDNALACRAHGGPVGSRAISERHWRRAAGGTRTYELGSVRIVALGMGRSFVSSPRHLATELHGRATVTLFENGVEFAHMSHPVPPPAEYSRLRARRAVYAGAIDNRFGVALLLELARARPDVEFVLIGSGTAVAEIAASRLANVHLLGIRPYADLPAYLQHASVGLLPLNAHPANAGRSPMKFYEYAAAGLPIAASLTPEFARRHEPFIRFFDPQDPAKALDEVLVQRPIPEPAHIASRDWSLIAQAILDHAVSSDGAKPSVN